MLVLVSHLCIIVDGDHGALGALEAGGGAEVLGHDVQVAVIPPLLVAEAAAELLQARRLRVQQRLVGPAEPHEQPQHSHDHCHKCFL